jgi:hypothetical protein
MIARVISGIFARYERHTGGCRRAGLRKSFNEDMRESYA